MASLKEMIELGKHNRETERKSNPVAAELRKRLSVAHLRNLAHEVLQWDGWFTKTEAARIAGVHRGTICRAVERKQIRTNGLTGWACLLDPQSVLEYCDRRSEIEEKRASLR